MTSENRWRAACVTRQAWAGFGGRRFFLEGVIWEGVILEQTSIDDENISQTSSK